MPPLSIPTKGTVTGKAEIDIAAGIQQVFDYIPSEKSLPEYLKSYGPIHAVVRSELHKGPWSEPGAYRTLYFETGDTLREDLLAFHAPTYFAYSISEFSNFAKHLSSIAYGEWSFKSGENKTNVQWKYTFKPKNILTKMVVSLFMHLYFRKYMQQSLLNAKKNIEMMS